ncbi:T9SS type A sorting domain-containing protein [Muricauda ruestringensis]|uniref:T9SS type A sorting domain-containing protein n=1 Tax=Flagellimonas aurea TaxID=2915619 RepID=A0ABS3G772_9FLAO|nr:YCF48-related protein [Allomuricauda aurea]MBO0355265.1 T9SS type A sorting domain-containing protein [Allomuricauda aurea]
MLAAIISLISIYTYSQTYLENFEEIGGFATIGNTSYFMARNLTEGWALWKTNGTRKGTQLIKGLLDGSSPPGNLFIFKNELYFASNTPGKGIELWKSDGTENGTSLLKDLNTDGDNSSSRPSNFTIYGDMLYFTASNQYISGPPKLHRTDGTTEGTVLVEDIIDAGDIIYSSGNLVVANNKLYFTNNGKLYETDGTTEGTKSMVIDGLENMGRFKSFTSGLYFITYSHNNTYIRLYRLTDLDNYTMLKEFSIESYSGLKLYGLIEVGEKVFFSLGSGNAYNNIRDALWVTDGTSHGTKEILNFQDPYLFGSGNFNGFVEHNGNLFFSTGAFNNHLLWTSDGTVQGTKQANTAINVNPYADMLVWNNKIYYVNGSAGVGSYDVNSNSVENYSPLRATRKTSGDKYFLKSDGRFVYFAVLNDKVQYQSSVDLYHAGPNPFMQIKSGYSIVDNGEEIGFDTKVDSLAIKRISIQNMGKAPLNFSKIQVSGEGFYINGDVGETSLPQQLAPLQTGTFEVGFLPNTTDVHSGYLIIRGDDTSQPEFRLQLKGLVSAHPAESVDKTFPTQKEIEWDRSVAEVQIDNYSILENAVIGSLIGTFSTDVGDDETFNYSLIEGIGDEDNMVFSISNNQLFVGDGFNDDFKNSYTIRVQATGAKGTVLEENIILGIIDESEEIELGDCEKIGIPLTSDLYDVEFLNDTDAIAVGANGVILKTFDKGATWQHMHVIEQTNLVGGLYTYPSNLYEIQFVNETTGFIAGSSVLLRTDDAGLNWKPLDFDQLGSLTTYNGRFMAVSPEVLFIYMERYIFKSNDGGQSWSETSYRGGFGDPRAIYFPNDELGFASNNSQTYFISNDGGETWTNYVLDLEELAYDEDITTFTFRDDNVGFAATNKGKVLKTEDQGQSWVVINAENRSGIKEIHFVDESIGYMIGGSIYETNDGGLTWSSVYLNVHASIQSLDINQLGDRIAVGTGSYENGRAIFASPSGTEWSPVSTLLGGGRVRDVIFDGDNAYFFSEYQSRKSNDGGVTWIEMTTPIDEKVYQAEKIGENLVIRTYNGEAYRSPDGGDTWIPIMAQDSYGALDVLDNTILFSKNLEGRITKSLDFGETWTPLADTALDHVRVLEFPSESIGFAGKSNGVSRTEDGGATWEELIVDPDQEPFVYGITFANDLIGIVSTGNGFYKTIDGGDSWEFLNLYTGYTSEIIALNELEWYIGANNGIYSTIDGGIHWKKVFNSNGDILDMDYVNGTIYISVNGGGVHKIEDDLQPINAGYIKGDKSVRVEDEEIYSILKHSDVRYEWHVEGNNKLISEDNLAKITWSEPGTYTVSTVPYSSCNTGVSSEIIVTVLERPSPPEIFGLEKVVENSNGHVYTTPLEDQVSYIWSVSGQRSYETNGNELIVDWGGMGFGEIGLIRTDLLTGLRSFNRLSVEIKPNDPFMILQSNTTCRGTSNGSLHIMARIPENAYSAKLTGSSISTSSDFKGELLLENLSAGMYDICLQDHGTNKEYCYQFTISEPEPFEVTSIISSSSSKQVDLQFKGGAAPYIVSINGRKIMETSQESVQITADNGDVLEVNSAGDCEFSYSKLIYFQKGITVIPNPVVNSFTASLSNEKFSNHQEVPLRIFNSSGQMVLSMNVTISNQTLTCEVSTLNSGIYIVQLGDNQKTSFKVIKK